MKDLYLQETYLAKGVKKVRLLQHSLISVTKRCTKHAMGAHAGRAAHTGVGWRLGEDRLPRGDDGN